MLNDPIQFVSMTLILQQSQFLCSHSESETANKGWFCLVLWVDGMLDFRFQWYWMACNGKHVILLEELYALAV